MEFSIEYNKDKKQAVAKASKPSEFILKLLDVTQDEKKIISQISFDGGVIWSGEASGDVGLVSILNTTGVFPINPEMIKNIRQIPKFLLKMMLKYVDNTINKSNNG